MHTFRMLVIIHEGKGKGKVVRSHHETQQSNHESNQCIESQSKMSLLEP